MAYFRGIENTAPDRVRFWQYHEWTHSDTKGRVDSRSRESKILSSFLRRREDTYRHTTCLVRLASDPKSQIDPQNPISND
jgi:hypothetical protein